MGHNITNSIREVARTFAHVFDPYRPELHYMRGPGPKWHAKWADHATQGPSPVVAFALTEIAGAHT